MRDYFVMGRCAVSPLRSIPSIYSHLFAFVDSLTTFNSSHLNLYNTQNVSLRRPTPVRR